ncbi:ABC transporter permease [Ruminiclostridium papyrosolvens]
MAGGGKKMEHISRIIKKPLTGIFLSIILGFVVGAIVLAIAGYNPIDAFASLFRGIFSKPKYISNTIIKATPIILTAVSVSFAFKTGLFNIGTEGQYIMGAITAAVLGYKLNLPGPLQILVVIIAAITIGAIYGGLVGLLKGRFGIHEVITGIMLNWIALYMNNFIITLPGLKKPNAEATYEVHAQTYTMVLQQWKTSKQGIAWMKEHPVVQEILLRTNLNYGILVAIIVVILVTFFLYRTTKGFELRAVGFNRDAAEFSGMNVTSKIILSMVIAGAISGLAGAMQITGCDPHRISTLSAFEGNGMNGLSVALIAGSSPVGCIFAGLFFSGLLYGGGSIQSDIGAPSEIISIMIGTIVFFVALATIFPLIADRLRKRGVDSVK